MEHQFSKTDVGAKPLTIGIELLKPALAVLQLDAPDRATMENVRVDHTSTKRTVAVNYAVL